MEKTILEKLGLTINQVIVYEELLKDGPQKASIISKKTPLKRGLVYKTLEELEQKGLIIREDDKDAVSIFLPIHPNVLKGLAENQLKQAKEAQESLQKELGSLVSMYNIANNKPGVEFYEGIEGVQKVLNDTLKSKTTIYTIIDTETSDKMAGKINTNYVRKRLLKGMSKKILAPDTLISRKIAKKETNDLTTYKFLPGQEGRHLYSTIQIYNKKVAYITYKNGAFASTVISDSSIYNFQQYIFETLWQKAKI